MNKKTLIEASVMKDTMVALMAGGEGTRLKPLTYYYPKPLVHFGAEGRIIDFTLNNCLVSGSREVIVLTQFLGEMIEDYLGGEWRERFSRRGASLRTFNGWGSRSGCFLGTAHAVFETLSVLSGRFRFAVVLAGDHIYRMDYRPMLAYHQAHGKAATVAAVGCEPSEAKRFGIIRVDGSGKISRFVEKPADIRGLFTAGGKPLASMGVYVFDIERVLPMLERAIAQEGYDLGSDVFPELVLRGEAYAFPFTGPDGGAAYWRDVGDLPSYWRAQMDLVQALAEDSNDPLWRPVDDGSFITRAFTWNSARRAQLEIVDSLIARDVCLGSCRVQESVLGPRVVAEDGAVIRNSVILEAALIKADARIVNAVVEPGATVRERVECRPAVWPYSSVA
jgi:glucose-1-phosphate adenylyltransferase